jgi:hypothetical protein
MYVHTYITPAPSKLSQDLLENVVDPEVTKTNNVKVS